MTEDVNISKIIELANKYSLKVFKYKFNTIVELQVPCGLLGNLLIARIKYTEFNNLVKNIEMPEKYITTTVYSNSVNNIEICCQGWMQAQGLFSFERKLQFLLENYKKCEVEFRRLELENDFK